MLKTLDCQASYEPSRRSLNWLKLKKDYIESGGGSGGAGGLGDSLDLVVIGAWYGNGKRTGGFGSYLLAVYDIDTEEFESVCRAGTGFSDTDLERFTDMLLPRVTGNGKQPAMFRADGLPENGQPDVWFSDDQLVVWEIRAADLTLSPLHCAGRGKVHPERGVALRFPRFIRERTDKKPTDATTSDQIADFYQAQSATMSAPLTVKTNGIDDGDLL